MGVDTNKNALLYTRGFLVAEEGSNIANWITSNDGFYHLNSSNKKDLWLSPGGINGTVNNHTDNMAIYAGGKFGVSTSGKLYATEANINGTIVSNNATITGGSLKVGNNFSVDSSGNLTAKNANIQGTIVTTNLTASGTVNINDANIKTASIDSATLSNCNISAGQINSGVLSSARIPNLSAGKITSGTMSADRISGGTLSINTREGGFLKAGAGTTHAVASGLTIDGNGGIDVKSHDISNVGKMTGVESISSTSSIKMLAPVSITGGLTTDALDINGKVKVGGNPGKSTEKIIIDAAGAFAGKYECKWMNGILVYFQKV